MFQRYVKYLVVCYLVLIIVINAVADISLDYYFGNEKPIRSTNNIGDCNTEQMADTCFQKCGPNHACLLGQCFCVQQNTPHKEKENFRAEDDDTPSSEEANLNDAELGARPALRHHIAHFCPNLHDARKCIRKCMKVAKPAFCGKDHHCYCGHRYDFPGVESNLTAADVRDQFRDLYEKYFGPKKNKPSKISKLKA